MKKLDQLRAQYPKLSYSSYKTVWNTGSVDVKYTYELGDHVFHHQLTLPYPQLPSAESQNLMEPLIQILGLLEGFNYWKLAASPLYESQAVEFPPEILEWAHTTLFQGMGEYFFVNDIDFTIANFVQIKNHKTASTQDFSQIQLKPEVESSNSARTLIPLGGGKDSIVTLELLKKIYPPTDLAVALINPTQAAKQIAQASNLPTLEIKRAIDPKLLALNAEGTYLNGHVPVSAIFALILTLTAWLNNFDKVAVSNERSSNEASLTFHNQPINHQFSKSFEFEHSWELIRQAFTPAAPLYYSFVRPLYEIQIVKLFSKMTEHHSLFKSCNRGSKSNIWCGECPKCLFAALLLQAFLPPSTVSAIFGADLLQKESLKKYLDELTGITAQKPLECVGTREESQLACFLAIGQYQKAGLQLPHLLNYIQDKLLSQSTPDQLHQQAQALLASWNSENLLPVHESQYLQRLITD